jgi:hypothetical protein
MIMMGIRNLGVWNFGGVGVLGEVGEGGARIDDDDDATQLRFVCEESRIFSTLLVVFY